MSAQSARTAILDAIRKNLDASRPHDALRNERHHAPPVPTGNGDLDAVKIQSADTLARSFEQNLSTVGGRVSVVSDVSEAMQAVQRIIDDLAPKRVAISDSPLVDQVLDGVATDAEILRNASADELFTCDIGITSAQFAIAETGTLVLRSEKEFARLTSLVPDVHICVLDGSQVQATMTEVLAEMQRDLDPAVTFITGPSRTSDIELTVAIGVHGPRELYVVVVDHQ